MIIFEIKRTKNDYIFILKYFRITLTLYNKQFLERLGGSNE